jgi:hypothetical protein
MTALTTTVTVYWDLSAQGGDFFTLDDATKGVLDGATYVLAGDIATEITAEATSLSVTRGRSRQLDEITTGVGAIELKNNDRDFDPLHTTGPYYGNIKPGKRATISVEGVAIFDGLIDDYGYEYAPGRVSMVRGEIVDGLGQLAARELDEFTATNNQLAGARITAVLNRTEVNYPANRSIDAGVSTLQNDTVAWGTNALAYLQLVARSDLGYLYADRNGVLTYKDRHYDPGDSAATFGDGGIPFIAVERSTATELLYNRVGVSRLTGSEETFTNVTSAAEHGYRSLTRDGLLLDTNSQSYDMGLYLLGLYDAPEERFKSITIAVDALTAAERGTVLALDITSMIRIVWTPDGVGDPIDRYCIVEGVEHQSTPHTLHYMTLYLGDADNRVNFRLDDTQFGVLDGTSVLAF